jgi:nucleoside-diphosphate-sugar epimerase
MAARDEIVDINTLMLVTGAGGFVGTRVVENLLDRGFRNIRCLVRSRASSIRLNEALEERNTRGKVEVVTGNLLSREDCVNAAGDVALIYHLAAGTGTKSFSDAYLNSVVTTRNLLETAIDGQALRRFVNVSSFAVYSNYDKPNRRVLDEAGPVEAHPESRAEAYGYGKSKQDELVIEYGRKHAVPYVIMRPGNIFGPGKKAIPGRVGIDTFGIFMNFGGANPIPLTYVDNCAEAIVLAGIKPGIEGEIFNVVDDDLPSCWRYLRLYKKNVKHFKSIYVPHAISYLFCYTWETYSKWSKGQLPPVFTRREWHATWKKTRYTNRKLKEILGWTPKVPMDEGLRRFFEAAKLN